MKYCNKCKKTFSVDFEFCPMCGNRLEAQIECPNCKKIIDVDFRFCPYCGSESVRTEEDKIEVTKPTLDNDCGSSREHSIDANTGWVPGKREYDLGDKYYYGNYVEKNEEKAFEWYLQAAERGYAEAQIKIGDKFAQEYDNIMEQSIEEDTVLDVTDYEVAKTAIKWYYKAAEQGNAEAQFKLGNMYYDGCDESHSPEDAIEWFYKSAKQGYAEAQVKLGDIFYLDYHTKIDEKGEEKAVELYHKAAEQGYAEAQVKLGIYYNNIDNVEEAIKWYHKAAEQGNVDAFLGLGEIYTDDEAYNIKEAIKWYYKAAEQDSVEAFLALANIYNDDKTCNVKEAVKWCYKAIEQGDEEDIDECGDLLNSLGNRYLEGSGTAKDCRKSVECFRKAAEVGNKYAQYNLALAYYTGNGIEQNYSMAALFFTAAAKQGDVDAQNNMGVLHEKGQGVPKSLEKAIEWYSKAAEQGHEGANESLARVNTKLDNLNKSKNYPHMHISGLGEKICGLALNNAFNDNLWQACGFKKTPERGSIFNSFVSSEILNKETFLTREFIIAPLGIFVGKLRKRAGFHIGGFITYLINYILEREGVSDSLKFNDINIAKKYFRSYISEYVKKDSNLHDIFLNHCRNNHITIDSVMVAGAQVVCDSLSNFLDYKIEEIDNKYYIENDLTEYGTFKPLLIYGPDIYVTDYPIQNTSGKKYELINERKIVNGQTLFRIRALKDIEYGLDLLGQIMVLKNGSLGGFIASENNLSQEGNCWVTRDAMVFDNARVQGNAKILNTAKVYGNAIIGDESVVSGESQIFGNAQVLGKSDLSNKVLAFGATIIRNSKISLHCEIKDKIIENATYASDTKY